MEFGRGQVAAPDRAGSAAGCAAAATEQAARTKAATAGEPRDPGSAAATSFRQWCQDTLKPAVQA